MGKFFLTVFSIYGLINFYILWWTWRHISGNEVIRLAVCIIFLILAIGFPLFYRSSGSSLPEIWMLRAGTVWIGLFLYLFAFALLTDFLGMFGLLKGNPYVFPCIIAFLALITFAGWLNARNPVLTEINLTAEVEPAVLKRLSSPHFSIAAFADIHLGRIVSPDRLEKAAKLLEGRTPDIVVFLGDFLDDHVLPEKEKIKGILSNITSVYGTYGILGNHEYISGNIDDSIALMEENGIQVLRDDWRTVGNSVLLVGRDDRSKNRFSGVKRKELNDLLNEIPEQDGFLPMILLDHQPYRLQEAEAAGATLQLSGHTHNGQLWPFNLIVKRIYENPRGYSKRGKTHYVVSVGTGTWGPPLRNNARPEVLLINLTFVEKKPS